MTPAVAQAVLDDAAAGGVTLFAAPPGWLRTEDLSAVLSRERERVLWVRLGPEDRDPGTLLVSLAATVERLQPGFGQDLLELAHRQCGPVAEWIPLFSRLGSALASVLGPRDAFVLEHVDHLDETSSTFGLLGGQVLPALPDGLACVLTSHGNVPAAHLPSRTARRGVRDLRVERAVAWSLLEVGKAGGLSRRATDGATTLAAGRAAVLVATRSVSEALGAAPVERDIRDAGSADDLLARLAASWLEAVGEQDRQALGLAVHIGYSHADLTAAAFGRSRRVAAGPWLQPLAGGWSRVPTVWQAPLRRALAPEDLPGAAAVCGAADRLLQWGAVEQAVPLYLDQCQPAAAARALADEAGRLMGLGQWGLLEDWLNQLKLLTPGAWSLTPAAEPHPGLSAGWRSRMRNLLPGWRKVTARSGREPASNGAQVSRAAVGLQPDPVPAAPPAAPSGAAPQPHTLAAHLLGRFSVMLNDVPVESWPGARSRSLCKYLLTHRDQGVPRDVLMETFWPKSPPEAARNSLNVAMHGLRRAFRVATDVPVVIHDGGIYTFHPDLRVWLDVEEFERYVAAGQRLEAAGELAGAMAEYELAATLCQGDFVAEEPYEQWPALTRERLRMAALDTLDRLSRLYFDQRRYAACATLCQRIIDRDPCREDAHRRLMRCYHRLGQTHLAVRQFQACAQRLRAELGVDPAPATITLSERIRRREHV